MHETMVRERRPRKQIPDRRSDHSKSVPLVYFLLIEDSGPLRIKIGETEKGLAKRLSDHNRSGLGIKQEITPLCVIRGDHTDERRIHRYFAAELMDGEKEIFDPSERLKGYVRWLRDQYFTWVPDCQYCTEMPDDSLPQVESTLWLPNESRTKVAPLKTGLFDEFGPLDMPPREVSIDDFYTNQIVIDAAREVLGEIDLDPASHSIANEVVKAKKIFTMHDNGLNHPWHGRVWLNPPFSQWQEWIPKILSEWRSGRVDAMCILSANRTTSARYFEPIKSTCVSSCSFNGRIPFWGGLATSSPDDGHTVYFFGSNVLKFYDVFSTLGTVSLTAKHFAKLLEVPQC